MKRQRKNTQPKGPAPQRPQNVLTLWEQRDQQYPSLTAKCSYLRPHFTVVVAHDGGTKKSESFPHTFEPVFGMDVIDQNLAVEIAVRLSDDLAADLKLKPSAAGP